MQEPKYIPWSANTYPPQDKMLIMSANEKGGDLQVGDLKQNVGGGYAPGKRPSLVESVMNVITKFFVGPSDTKCPRQPPEPYTTEKEKSPCDKQQIFSASATMPIFETKKDGTGRLTVPLDYDSTADDLAMTPAGVYVEDMPRSARNTTRPVGLRKRRKHQSKGTQQSSPGGGWGGGGGGGESAKTGGKNRKDKKRHNLRMDIVNDSLALSMDDCYGYDYREAEFEDAIGSASMSQCCLPPSFSPSSIGSVSSFHDALQDALVMEACMQESFGAGPSPSVEVSTAPTPHQQDAAVTRRTSTTPTPTVGDRVGEPKCDIESDRSGFVVFTDYEVFTTPSASPARRRPPLGLCKAFTYVWRRQCSDGEDEDDGEEEEEEEEDEENNSNDATEDEFEYDDDDECGDEDDDSVVFCEELDDNDDSNSSSGFEEKKVRFNMKPVVHVMRAWDFAYRQARKGDWEMAARDRERFRKRIDDLELVLGPALLSTVRDKIYAERFRTEEDNPTRRKSEAA